MIFLSFKFLIALVLLVVSADMIVRSAVKIADYFKVSKLLVGLFVIGFGTSLPELVAGLQAARLDATPIVLGNVIGSNIANIFLVMGMTALIYPITCDKKFARRDGMILFLSTLLFMGAGFYQGEFSMYLGIFFVTLFFGYIAFVLKTHPRAEIEAEVEISTKKMTQKRMVAQLLLLMFFLVLLGVSADYAIESAIVIAEYLGISQAVIGLTVIAVGTSLPELATCVMAARQHHTEIVFGNIMGSNIYNILAIPGFASLINPLQFEQLTISLWILLFATSVFLFSAISFGRFSKHMGVFFLSIYGLYTFLIMNY